MGNSPSGPGRLGLGAPRRFAPIRIIVEGFDQAGEHFRGRLEERLNLRFRDFFYVLAQMPDELPHPSPDLLRVVNRLIFG
jgi:hypothetical protein